MENNFKINITKEFRDYLNSLNANKKSIVISKLLFLESTGFLGNCKALGNNIFEYKIDVIKDDIKCFMDNNNILFFIKQKDNNDVISLEIYNNEALKDLKFARILYNEVYNLYKQTDEEIFFINILKNSLVLQGKENFKLLHGSLTSIICPLFRYLRKWNLIFSISSDIFEWLTPWNNGRPINISYILSIRLFL